MQHTLAPSGILTEKCLFVKMISCESRKEKIQAQVFSSINDIDETEWNSIAQNEFLNTSALQVQEKAKLNDFNYYYTCFYQDEELVGIAYFQLIEVNSKHYTDFSDRDIISRRVYKYISTRRYPMLIAGHLFFNGFSNYSIKEGVNKDDYFKAYFTVLRLIQKESKAKIVMMKEADEELGKAALQNKFSAMPADYFMQMPVLPEWSNINDYVSALSKKYAARARKVIASAEPLEIKDFTLNDVKKYAEELLVLYNNVTKKATVKLGILNVDFFVEMKKNLGANFKVFGYFYEGKLIAFASGILSENAYETYYIGLDEDKTKEFGVYQHILVMGVEKAIEYRKKTLILGRTSLEAKAIIGCKPRLIPNYIRFSNRFLQMAANFIINNFNQTNQTDWEKRNPFK